jgi:hypothetical protein
MQSKFPFLAASLGLLFMAILVVAGTRLPLLTLLFISEFAGILNLAGAYVGLQALRKNGVSAIGVMTVLCCVLLALAFLLRGFQYWPH